MLKPIAELNFGHNDAVSYLNGRDKDLFSRLFLSTPEVERLKEQNVFFLVGEKGTGKTAFAVHIANGDNNKLSSIVVPVSATEYRRFYELKQRSKLDYSDYTAIWRVLLLLLMCQKVRDDHSLLDKAVAPISFTRLCNAIDKFYSKAFDPEIEQAFEFIRDSRETLKIVNDFVNIEDRSGEKVEIKETRIKMNLLSIEKILKSCLRDALIKKPHIIFIDGVDQRPQEVPFREYKETTAGLLEAVWQLNNDYILSEKRLRGKVKVVALCRPDIMYKVGMHNVTSRLADNSIVLKWATNSVEMKQSLLYKLTNHLLGYQQDDKKSEINWFVNYWDTRRDVEYVYNELIKVTWHRPRDIVQIFKTLKTNRSAGLFAKDSYKFTIEELRHPKFTSDYSTYMLGEVRDYAQFYFNSDAFDEILTFFQYLNGKVVFNYKNFLAAYEKFIIRYKKQFPPIPQVATADAFLQFLYDVNIICYFENAEDREEFIHWSYREKSFAEVYPKIKTEVDYKIHPGISKALNLGKSFSAGGVERNSMQRRRR